MGSTAINVDESNKEDGVLNDTSLSNSGEISKDLSAGEGLLAKHLESLEGVISELTNVEGYNTEPWGSAVDVKNLSQFYPTTLTRNMNDEEFKEFLASASDTDEPVEDTAKNCNNLSNNRDVDDVTTPILERLSLSPLPIPNDGTSISEAVVPIDEDKLENIDNLEKEMEIVDDVVNGANPAEYFGPLKEPFDTRCPSPAQGYTNYLDKDINEIPDDVITPGFVLDFVLRGNKPEDPEDPKLRPKTSSELDANGDNAECSEIVCGNEMEVISDQQESATAGNTSTSTLEMETDTDTTSRPLPEEVLVGLVDTVTIAVPNSDVRSLSNDNGDALQKEIGPRPVDDKLQIVNQVELSTPSQSRICRSTSQDTSRPSATISSFSHMCRQCSVFLTRLPISKLNSVQLAQLSERKKSMVECDSVRQQPVTLARSQTISNQAHVIDFKDSLTGATDVKSKESEVSGKKMMPVKTGPMECIIKLVKTVEDEDVNIDTDDDGVPVDELPKILTVDRTSKSLVTASRRSLRISSVVSSKSSSESLASFENVEKSKNVDHGDGGQVLAAVANSHTNVKIPKKIVATETSTTDSPTILKTARNTRGCKRKLEANISEATKVDKPAAAAPVLKTLGEKPISQMNFRETLNFIKNEAKKPSPNFVRLSEAMTKTYVSKRKAIYESNEVRMRDVLQFPELLHYQMVKEEYGRIKKDIGKMSQLEAELDGAIISALEPKKKGKKTRGKQKRHALWDKALQLWEEHKPDSSYCKILGILVVCFEFAENAVITKLCRILKKGEQPSALAIKQMVTPTIVVQESDIFKVDGDSEIWIYVESKKYLRVPNMYEAVLSAFACHYLLNIHYNSKLKSLFEFFDMLNGNSQTTYSKTKI